MLMGTITSVSQPRYSDESSHPDVIPPPKFSYEPKLKSGQFLLLTVYSNMILFEKHPDKVCGEDDVTKGAGLTLITVPMR
jgi:hypothetical protein